jgi:two-component system, LytTR family, sensor kinase
MAEPSQLHPNTRMAPAARGVRYPGIPAFFLIWSLVGVLSYIHGRPAYPAYRGFSVLDLMHWLACFWPWAGLTPLVFALEKRFPLQPQGWLRNVAVLALAGVGMSYLSYLITATIWMLDAPLFSRARLTRAEFWTIPAGDFLFQQMIYWVSVAAGALFRNWIRYQQQENERAQLLLEKSRLESSLRQAELDVLRMRLNPHFLFNTLQNISVLTQDEPQVASRMLTRLGDLLRSALRSSGEAETPLSEEIALTEAYIAIEQMRFGNRLQVKMDLSPTTLDALVPTLLLQPIVENAIRHGLREAAGSGILGVRSQDSRLLVSKAALITIRSEVSNSHLVLTVSDNGSGLRGKSLHELTLGVGLASTRDRLARMYGNEGNLAITPLNEGGTLACLTLPFRRSARQPTTYEQATAAHCR